MPNLFLGMQHLSMGNLALANEYLKAANSICAVDPQVFNELGVVCYRRNDYDNAIRYFNKAIELSKTKDIKEQSEFYLNMGHTLRKANMFEKALENFEKALTISPKNSNCLTSIGLTYLKLEKLDIAITFFHKVSIITI